MTNQKAAIWGGIECTINRVGQVYYNQLIRSGHANRVSDIDRLAGLGLKTVRYPLLWEALAPHKPDSINWEWADERVNRLADTGIRPIVGLVHHGCGPRYATFTNPEQFESGLAAYALKIAAGYPWITAYTPVNEPLTTARFSGLYGHWYPHRTSAVACLSLLFSQCRAIISSMAAIRTVNSESKLVQTEDLGKTHSIAAMGYQADWENERRWLTWDLLTGRFTPAHSLWDYCRWLGFTERELWYFAENPCYPDVIGINHYITSERYLDDRLSLYPEHMHGGNGQHRYVDTEAVRAAPAKRVGLPVLIAEAWSRYTLPLALTEVHIGCTPDEQIRWLQEAWQAAQSANEAGIPVSAVTAWALFGSYDWHCLVTRPENRYEPGAFTCAGALPAPTLLSDYIRCLATGKPVQGIVPPGKGWWHPCL